MPIGVIIAMLLTILLDFIMIELSLKKILFGIVAFVALIVLFSSYYTIDEGEEGVVLRYGKAVRTSGSGLYFKMPVIESVVKFSTRTETMREEKIPVYSKDQQPADTTISITFHIVDGKSSEIYNDFGNIQNAYSNVIRPNMLQDFKNVFGKYTAAMAIQERERLVNDAINNINRSLNKYPAIQVTGIQIEDINFSQTYEKTIEDRMKAEVEVQKAQQELSKEKVQADIALTQAKAKADAQLLAAEAEAKSLDIKGEAIHKNPEIVKLTYIEKWNGQLPQVSGSATPLINLSNLGSSNTPSQ